MNNNIPAIQKPDDDRDESRAAEYRVRSGQKEPGESCKVSQEEIDAALAELMKMGKVAQVKVVETEPLEGEVTAEATKKTTELVEPLSEK